jgi:hypothetical protein
MVYTDKEDNAVVRQHSDGSELIPAEVQANKRAEGMGTPPPAGYTVDEEGLVNNYATEPQMSEAKYPSPEKQRRYIFQGAIALLFVALTVWLAFAVS